jgi:hypothetical protein
VRSVSTVPQRCHPETALQGAHASVDHLVSVKVALEDGWTDLQINSEENLAATCKQCNAGKVAELMPLRCVLALYMRRMKNRGAGP